MTPQELDALYLLLEDCCKQAYTMGYTDAKEGRPKLEKGFKPNKATRLIIKTNFEKHLKKR